MGGLLWGVSTKPPVVSLLRGRRRGRCAPRFEANLPAAARWSNRMESTRVGEQIVPLFWIRSLGMGRNWSCFLVAVVVVWTLGGGRQAMGDVTAQQRAKLAELSEATRDAGRLYTEGKYQECAQQITAIQQQFLELIESRDAQLLRMAKPLYERLARAHGLLDLEGAELQPLPTWEQIVAAPSPPEGQAISFSQDVAPWLVAKCGNCHINNRRGQFSMATFADLVRGVNGNRVFFPGESRGSRLVEVIESGDMPRGGGKVSAEELASLKGWIDQGATFDGPAPTSALVSYARPSADPSGERSTPAPPTVKQPTGSETVSFARDIAPLLRENCNGCHIAGRRASGNFRMDTFAQLLRGGDSGPVIAGTNANESLLIRKLKGQAGQRMPAGGRPPLSDEQIALIATWIREGAPFDGPAPSTNIDVVINQGWAATASPEELFQRRKERALQRWERAVPGDAPATAEIGEAFVLGNASPDQIDASARRVADAIERVKRGLRLDKRSPLLRGGLVVFVLKSRYDYSEFGKMTEGRELPKEWVGHWYADPIDVYVVLSAESDLEPEQLEAVTLQNVAGAYVGSFAGVPYWFAEGVGRNLVVTNYRRGDRRVVEWQQSLPAALQKVTAPPVLLDNRLDEETAGLVGMALVNTMMDRANSRRFSKLMELMREGKAFDEAMAFAFAPPEEFVALAFGKKPPEKK
ncbi:MAG: hypothetical protein D6753_05370 [Planctomycetota bacterium]|nr:MAG: hypothetical protein D6753_05370 [Planctomycetota bacterium]